MLGKLMKHELKATARLLLPLYLLLAVITVLERVMLSLNFFQGTLELIPVLITFIYIMSIVTIVVVSFILIIQRFYKNFLTDEGYLMFTLPVKSYDLINSKLLVSLLWTVASIAAVGLSLLGVFATPDRLSTFWEFIQQFMTELRAGLGTAGATIFILEFILLCIIGTVSNILMIYVSIAVGQLFHGHKIIGSFAAYAVITTALQIIVSMIFVLLSFIFHKEFAELDSVPQLIFPVSLLFCTAFTLLFYFVTDFIFKKKINLE